MFTGVMTLAVIGLGLLVISIISPSNIWLWLLLIDVILGIVLLGVDWWKHRGTSRK